jgi:hypothetical protein
VRALRNIHSALRPGGLLLDIHPEPKHPWLVAQVDAQAIPVGQLDESFRIGTVRSARAALQSVIDEGLFVSEREMTFIFTYYFADVDAWLSHMAGQWASAGIPADMAERASELLATGEGELRIPREIHAARLRKPKGSAGCATEGELL